MSVERASQTAGRPLHHSVTPAIKKTFPSAEKPQLILNDRPSKLYCRALWRAFALRDAANTDFVIFPLPPSRPVPPPLARGVAGEWHVSFNGPGAAGRWLHAKKLKKASFIRDFMCRLLSAGPAVKLVKNGGRTRSQLVVAYRSLLTRRRNACTARKTTCWRCFTLSGTFYNIPPMDSSF